MTTRKIGNDTYLGSLLTSEELEIVEALAVAWGKFIELPVLHPSHNREFEQGVHYLQRMIMSRPVSKQLNKKR